MTHRIAVILLTVVLAGCEKPTAEQRAPIDIDLPEPESAGAKLVMSKCIGCHVPPRPDMHTRSEWPGIVHRMQNYRVVKGYGGLLEPEFKRVIEYLQNHAKPD